MRRYVRTCLISLPVNSAYEQRPWALSYTNSHPSDGSDEEQARHNLREWRE